MELPPSNRNKELEAVVDQLYLDMDREIVRILSRILELIRKDDPKKSSF